MKASVLYFDVRDFKDGLSTYLKNYSTVYVTAMCPVCMNGYTIGIYVTVRGE